MPMTVANVYVAKERPNCRGAPCPDSWTQVLSVTSKTNASVTKHVFEEDDQALQGVRYVHVELLRKRSLL